MCLAIPAKVVALGEGDMVTVSLGGILKPISSALLDTVALGDFVLVHVGYALQTISEAEAQRTLSMMAESGLLEAELEEIKGEGMASEEMAR